MSFRRTKTIGLGIIVAIIMCIGLVPTVMVSFIAKHNVAISERMHKFNEVIALQKRFWLASTAFDKFTREGATDYSAVLDNLEWAYAAASHLAETINISDKGGALDDNVAIEALIRDIQVFRMAVNHYSREAAYDPAADNTFQLEAIGHKAQQEAVEAFDQFMTATGRDILASQQSIHGIIKKSETMALVGLAIGVLTGVVVAILLSRALSRPIHQLVQGTRKMAQGDLSFRIDCNDTDEIGQLAQAFNQMAQQLNQHIQQQEDLIRQTRAAAQAEQRQAQSLNEANQRLQAEIERRQAIEQNLLQAKEAAESADRAKTQFLANMSHEFRTPLNHIIGFTELVVDRRFGDLNEIQSEYLGDALQSSRHLFSLINDVLDLAKIEAGKLSLKPARIKVKALLERSLKMIRQKALQHKMALSVQVQQLPAQVMADERKLRQIMYNLLSNAAKFTPDGGAIAVRACQRNVADGHITTSDGRTITLNAHKRAASANGRKYMEVSVSDTGIGLQADDLERIFQPFEQVEDSYSRHYQGTGLGLSLVRRLVELHGGRIWAESKGPHQGATFRFLIPLPDIIA